MDKYCIKRVYSNQTEPTVSFGDLSIDELIKLLNEEVSDLKKDPYMIGIYLYKSEV